MDFHITEEDFSDELKKNQPVISSSHWNCIDRKSSTTPSEERAKYFQDDPTQEKRYCYDIKESSIFTAPIDLKVRNMFDSTLLSFVHTHTKCYGNQTLYLTKMYGEAMWNADSQF